MADNRPPFDAAWVRAAIEKFEGPLVLYATRIVGEVEHARDVVQETFLRLCQQDHREIEKHLAEWLYTVCRNRALDVLRKEKRMSPLTAPQLAKRESREPSPPDALARAESQSQVLSALAALAGNQQEVIRLKFQHSLSYREISKVTGLSESHVGVLIHKGLKAIRQKLGEEV